MRPSPPYRRTKARSFPRVQLGIGRTEGRADTKRAALRRGGHRQIAQRRDGLGNLAVANRVKGVKADVLGGGHGRERLEHEAQPRVLRLRADAWKVAIAEIEPHRHQVKALVRGVQPR